MKRCPQCNRLESEDALAFCRVDGTALISESGAIADDVGTAKFGSPGLSSEVETNILPNQTNTDLARTTAPTTVLSTPTASAAGSLTRTKPRQTKIIIVVIITSLVAATTAIVVNSYRSGRSGKSIQSIAVMPFVNASGNAELDYLSDGMTETLIKGLSQLPNLNVKARSTVFRYKGRETDGRAIGKELGVQALLNGRVIQRGSRLFLNLELIDAQTENVIWADQYERKLSDLLALQSEIARDVSSKLKTKLAGTDEQKLVKTYTTNAEAYRLYLQGRFYWNKREEKDFRKAAEYYNQAIALDPNYALAFAGQADAYALLATFGFMSPTEGVPKAREFARQALALDESMAEPQTTLAYLSASYDYDFTAAEREFKRALELNPNYATAHQWYAEILSQSGRFDEAEAEFRRALEIEPLSIPFNWDYGRFLYHARRFDESLAQHKKTIELDPSFARVHRTLAEVYRVTGDYANAVEERAKVLDLMGQTQNAALVRATFAKRGWRGFLRLVVAEDSSLKDVNNDWVMAKAYVDLGEKNRAFAKLNEAYDKRLSSLCWLKIEPQLDPLRSDPRFQELLEKVRFP
ncbi:MAG TPA: tetratricopeptide repeat protein [Pyrinomonadaceae bacterium]|nr:tetratricopeptide repeat protein [Pyrinomonadaceae bacterium]